MRKGPIPGGWPRLARAFARDRRGAAAVEMALLALPFLLLLIAVMQLGVYYMTQVELDIATVKTAENLRAVFSTGTTPVTLSGSALKSYLVAAPTTGMGAPALNASSLAVEVQPLANLGAGVTPVSDGLANYGSAWTPLVLRAKYTISTFMPGVASSWSISSSAIVRRQGQ